MYVVVGEDVAKCALSNPFMDKIYSDSATFLFLVWILIITNKSISKKNERFAGSEVIQDKVISE